MPKLGTACNTLAADGKYPVLNRDNLTIPIQIQLSQKRNTFSQFVATFWKSRLHFKYFEKKKITLIDFVFSKLRTPKTYSDKCLKRPVSENPSTSNIANVEIRIRSPLSYSLILLSQSSVKKSLLLTRQILAVLVNALASNEKNFVLHRDNLTIPIQMQLSQQQKTFSQSFAAFLKSGLHFKHFLKKVDTRRFCIFEVTDFQNVVR